MRSWGRTMNQLRHAVIAAASALPVLLPQKARAQPNIGTVRGAVVTADLTPVEGASVTLSPGGRTALGLPYMITGGDWNAVREFARSEVCSRPGLQGRAIHHGSSWC